MGAESLPDRRSTAFTQRVESGAYYTDGAFLVQVVSVHPLGTVRYADVRDGMETECGIDRFRRSYWLVKSPLPVALATEIPDEMHGGTVIEGDVI